MKVAHPKGVTEPWFRNDLGCQTSSNQPYKNQSVTPTMANPDCPPEAMPTREVWRSFWATSEQVVPWVGKREVYFIQAASGPIKIGCTYVARKRLKDLQRDRGEPLTLLATLPGSFWRERVLHECFAADRLEGEWFKPSPDLLAFVERAKAYGHISATGSAKGLTRSKFVWADDEPAQNGPDRRSAQ